MRESEPIDSGDLKVNLKRIERRLNELAEYGKNVQGGVDRVAFSQADIQGRKYLVEELRMVGLKVSIDAAGNIIGRIDGSQPGYPPILFGSHSDSVPNGGKFDGTVGVICALECAQVLIENKITTRHPLEVVVFTDEEGGLVGSKAIAGILSDELLDEKSHSGLTIREGIRAVGGDPGSLSKVFRRPESVKAFLEVHIEQGEILDAKGINIGVVEGIVGINWWDVVVEGFSNHAGTTPMDRRQDALLAAAKLIISINRIVLEEPGQQVGTVGRIRAEPGAPNVIPGKVVMSLELRDLSSEKIQSLFYKITQAAHEIEQDSGVNISFFPIEAAAIPALTDPDIRKIIAGSAQELGFSWIMMPSGAGHDAQNMAKVAPTGMIFIPSVAGISHSPQEFSRIEDIGRGAEVLLRTILKIDGTILER